MELTLKELKPLLKYIITNNDELEKQGKPRVAINIVSSAGYGKSSIVEEIAREIDANFVKLNLAMISETNDLVGFPICLHYACKEDGSDCKGVVPELIDNYIKAGYLLTGETKMSYALPEGYKNINFDKPTILCLDDHLRALPNIIQSVYELIYKQELWAFKLPPRTTVILTNNPSGDYNVNDEDEAGTSRRINFNIKWDIDSWAEWAEKNEINNSCINFMLQYHHELMEDHGDHKNIMNARSYTMFANTISGISDWQNPSNLAIILQIASGCFNDPENIIGNLFTTFVANKLDKLIPPQEILLGDGKTVHSKLKSSIYDKDDKYNPAIAAILHTRLLNYTDYYFSSKDAKTKVVIDRFLEILHSKETLFDEDLVFNIIKTLYKKYPARMQKEIYNPEIRAHILG